MEALWLNGIKESSFLSEFLILNRVVLLDQGHGWVRWAAQRLAGLELIMFLFSGALTSGAC